MGKRRGIELRSLAHARDDFGVLRRRGCARQRAFEARHCRQQLLVGQGRGALRVREEEFETQ